MLSDGLTKILPDQRALENVMQNGEFVTRYSSLCEGELWEPHKGLPPPKSSRAKDAATQAFIEAFAQADSWLTTLHDEGLRLGGRQSNG